MKCGHCDKKIEKGEIGHGVCDACWAPPVCPVMTLEFVLVSPGEPVERNARGHLLTSGAIGVVGLGNAQLQGAVIAEGEKRPSDLAVGERSRSARFHLGGSGHYDIVRVA